MSMLLKLGWRNIWRNKRRSILTIAAITFGTFLTITFGGLVIGTWEYSIASSVEMFSGYIQIQKKGFQENPSLSKNFKYPGQIEECIKNIDGVTGYAPRIQADGLISFHDNSAGTSIMGVDPKAERKISRFYERVRNGRMIGQDGLNEVVVGIILLKNLKAEIGDTIVLLAQGYDGVLGNQKYRVVGTMKFGTPDIDAAMILLHYRAAQELLAMDGLINILAIGTPDLQSVSKVHDGIQASIKNYKLDNLAVLPWNEVMPELKQGMDLDRINHAIFMGTLVIIIAFGLMNTVLMSVTERFREFGVTLALGIRSSGLAKLVFLESICMALVGILLGVITGYLVNIYIYYHPIILTGDLAQWYEEYGFIPKIVSTIRLSVPLISSGLILVLSCVASIYPLYRVFVLEPLKGIRHT
jgi:ABC-type lipoprotein release transport system permease subunit